MVHRWDDAGRPLGTCSGTVIAPRAVLTAAHCLGSDTAAVDIDPGSGPWVAAVSFTPHPTYPRWALDAGIVLTADDLRRNPLPILTSRLALVGESVVIAGWGRDANEIGSVLRAGLAEITRVGAVLLQTDYSGGDAGSGICAGDSGGPLLLREGGGWAVGGIAAAASQLDVCSAPTTGYYAQLANAEILEFVLEMAPDVARR